MKTKAARLLAIAVLLVAVATASGIPQTIARAPVQKGMSYAAWWPGMYSDPDSDISLAQLAAVGAEWISLIVTQYQDTVASTAIRATEGTPTDADLIHVMTTAHSLGLKVMLKPHVDLWEDPAHWRGEIGSAFATQTQWSAWFASYRTFILHYADLAQTHGAGQFCVGTELSGTAHRASDWRGVIAAIRSHYSGPLVYAANWGGEETGLAWWDAVDFIGVDAYYPLSERDNPTVAELKAAWAPIAATLSGLSSAWGKSILFTEIGYRSQGGAAQHPWDWQVGGDVNLQEQADLYRATLESVWGKPWFGGIFWWAWGADPFEGGPCDDNYTPHDKPAEDVLRGFYGVSPRPSPAPAPPANHARTMPIYNDSLSPGWYDWSWGASVNFAAADQVYSGTRTIRVTLQPWGGLSLWHDYWDPGGYHYLEFYVRSAGPNPSHLWAFFYDDPDTGARRNRPADDCRYVDGGILDVGVWKRVLIPLRDMESDHGPLTRLALQESAGENTTFWVDEIQVVGATWYAHLPMVFRRP